VGFESTISAGERPQTYALDCAAIGTGTGNLFREYYYLTFSESGSREATSHAFRQAANHITQSYLQLPYPRPKKFSVVR
jgi:hypothetical protein